MTDEWAIPANEALKLHLVDPTTQKDVISFDPQFTYSIFGDSETIYGYKGLKTDIRFACDDCTPCVTASWDKKIDAEGDAAAEDPAAILQEHLPEDVFTDSKEWTGTLKARSEPFTPPGEMVHSYTTNGSKFEIYRTALPDPGCKKVLGNIQIMTEFYIEGGTQIPTTDEDWSDERWDVYFLYTTLSSGIYSLVGYVTLYNYFVYLPSFPYKDAGNESVLHARTRLSQFVILPPYQKVGHGSVLYDTVYKYYLADPNVLEITVEDPNEAFDILRYARDLPRLKAAKELPKDLTPSMVRKALRTPPPDGDLRKTPDTFLSALRKELKLPERYFFQLLELYLLGVLKTMAKPKKEKEEEEKAYRLLIKERVYRLHKDTLQELEEEERREKLQETYANIMVGYQEVLDGLRTKRRASDDEDMADSDEGSTRGAKRARKA